MNIVDSSHVKPLLEKLVAAQPSWRATLMKDWRLKWVNCNIDDDELVNLLMQKGSIVNRFPHVKDLAHKD